MRERHLNESRARDAVVSAFFESTGHVDLETLVERTRTHHPGVGTATVYRAMKLLVEAGIAHASHFGSKSVRFELGAGRAHHDHLVCQSCGTIVEFVSDEIERAQESLAARHGFELRSHKHELYGICEACRPRRTAPGRK
jgi:Fur family ferric uptake transcriptional regulator